MPESLILAERNLDAGREADEYGPGAGGKKRKVPAYPQIIDRDGEIHGVKGFGVIDDDNLNPHPPVLNRPRRSTRSRAAKACSFRKALFLRRKAALITLYLDAQSAIITGTARLLPHKGVIPEVPAFEKLIPSLEDVGVKHWAPDHPGWRNDTTVDKSPQRKTVCRTVLSARRRVRVSRMPIMRGGWAPEGSFEIDMNCKASNAMQARAKDQALLRKLVIELRAVVLSASKPPTPPPAFPPDEKPPVKSRRMIEAKLEPAATVETTPGPNKTSLPVGSMSSKEGSELGSGKKKAKKKKRSVLANQSNPHHVDNYRPSRTVFQDDPYEPYAQHLSLLFPPPLRLLSARPQRKTAPLPGVAPVPQSIRPAEDDYICCFCETALFFGTEKSRKRAIRRRRAELKRREIIRTKAKNVAEGKGGLRDDDDDDDYEDDDCGDDDGHGRCTCGRALSAPHGSAKSRLKPPEPDPSSNDIPFH